MLTNGTLISNAISSVFILYALEWVSCAVNQHRNKTFQGTTNIFNLLLWSHFLPFLWCLQEVLTRKNWTIKRMILDSQHNNFWYDLEQPVCTGKCWLLAAKVFLVHLSNKWRFMEIRKTSKTADNLFPSKNGQFK